MVNFLGLTTISLVFLITLIFAMKFRDIANILFVALFVRILFLAINNYVFDLPDAKMDAKDMEEVAFMWSQRGFLEIIGAFNTNDAQFLSKSLGIIYIAFGRNLIIGQSISMLFGVACVFMGWLLAKKIWNNSTAKKVALAIALYPTLISYSVLTMREVYITFFLLTAIFGIINWYDKKDFKSILLIIICFYVASVFHGATIVGLFVFFVMFLLYNTQLSINLLKKKIIDLKIILFFILFFILIYLYASGIIKFSYLGSFQESISFNNLQVVIDTRMKGNASYPEWTRINSIYDFLYKLPARMLYFLLSPFPWDIERPIHLLGLLDSFFHFILIILIIKNRNEIWKQPALRLILLILIIYFIVFSLGVSNFGTGIRHRSKFVIGLILLAGPLLPKLVILKKKLINLY